MWEEIFCVPKKLVQPAFFLSNVWETGVNVDLELFVNKRISHLNILLLAGYFSLILINENNNNG